MSGTSIETSVPEEDPKSSIEDGFTEINSPRSWAPSFFSTTSVAPCLSPAIRSPDIQIKVKTINKDAIFPIVALDPVFLMLHPPCY